MNGKAYDIGSGRSISFKDTVEKMVELAGSGRIEQVPWTEDRKCVKVGDYVADIQKAKTILGWKPLVGLERGLKRTIDFYKLNQKLYW
jgi:nucleoside-diphosphate-sugar epimerase